MTQVGGWVGGGAVHGVPCPSRIILYHNRPILYYIVFYDSTQIHSSANTL